MQVYKTDLTSLSDHELQTGGRQSVGYGTGTAIYRRAKCEVNLTEKRRHSQLSGSLQPVQLESKARYIKQHDIKADSKRLPHAGLIHNIHCGQPTSLDLWDIETMKIAREEIRR
jgi:hypothetical protein